jgi:outer membrane receptor for ferrienterochelin and colicin
VPETGTDLDLSYGHRFNAHTLIQADVYDANEAGALLSGNVVMTPAFAALAPPGYIAAYLNRIRSQCGGTPTLANLGVGTTYNAAGGRYQGVNISATVGIMRNVELSAQYGITSAKYVGIPTDILQNNPTLLDGGQIYGIPFRQGTATLAYQSPGGFGATIDPNYVGSPNGFNRGPYWFVNATVSQQVGGNSSINLGVNNWFNSIGQNYGYVGLGSFQPQNQYGQSTNAFQQGSEKYGLPYRQYWLTVTTRI